MFPPIKKEKEEHISLLDAILVVYFDIPFSCFHCQMTENGMFLFLTRLLEKMNRLSSTHCIQSWNRSWDSNLTCISETLFLEIVCILILFTVYIIQKYLNTIILYHTCPII